MTPSLAAFQAGFVDALFGRASPLACAEQPAFAVYRNTVMKGCVDALEANHPAVARLVGTERFRAAAVVHVAAEPPCTGSLLHYGEGFAAFLARFGPASEFPCLGDVALLDRFWIEAHTARDAISADGAWLASMTPEALGQLRVDPHPSARWRWFADAPVYSIWRQLREGRELPDDTVWQGEGALLLRPLDAVAWHPVSQADCAFLDACAGGLSLLEAAACAQAVQADVDIADLFARLLHAGALVPRVTAEECPP